MFPPLLGVPWAQLQQGREVPQHFCAYFYSNIKFTLILYSPAEAGTPIVNTTADVGGNHSNKKCSRKKLFVFSLKLKEWGKWVME